LNFLSHFHYDRKDSGNSLYHLGLVFPDFLKMLTLQRFKPEPIYDTQHPLYLGAMKHIERDGHFHSHAFFDDMCEKIGGIIDETPAKSIPKTWFLAHILLEMAIDRLLMEENISYLDEFYAELEGVKEDEIKMYFEHNKLSKADVFTEKLNKFIEHKWLYKYLEDDMLPKSLNRVYFRIGFTEEWNKETHQALIASLPSVLQTVKGGLKDYR
jgi:hypothetical protein